MKERKGQGIKGTEKKETEEERKIGRKGQRKKETYEERDREKKKQRKKGIEEKSNKVIAREKKNNKRIIKPFYLSWSIDLIGVYMYSAVHCLW